jgi:hypothetical protein
MVSGAGCKETLVFSVLAIISPEQTLQVSCDLSSRINLAKPAQIALIVVDSYGNKEGAPTFLTGFCRIATGSVFEQFQHCSHH